MKTEELKRKLEEEHVPAWLYSLDGGLPQGAYVLAQHGDQWEVYFSERGSKDTLATFTNEEAACQFLHDEVIRMSRREGLI